MFFISNGDTNPAVVLIIIHCLWKKAIDLKAGGFFFFWVGREQEIGIFFFSVMAISRPREIV